MKTSQLIGFALVCAAAAVTATSFTACDKGGDDPKPTYTVTFDADGGTPAPAAQTVTEGEKAAAPAAMTKGGYTFVRWSRDGVAAYDFSAPVTASFTLTARWQEEILVTEYWQVAWTLGGGAWPEDDDHADEVVRGLALAEPAAPTRDGYTFDGWYADAALTVPVAFPYSTEGFTADFTLYAGWTEREAVYNHPLIGKWEAAENALGIVSVEFGVSGNYIVVADGELPSVTRAEDGDDDGKEPAVYFGNYTIGSNVVTLFGLGTMTFDMPDWESASFTLDVDGAGGAVDISAAKAKEMPASAKTDLLCRTWKFVDYETNDTGDPDDAAYVYFSRAGTYLISYTDGFSELSNWSWKSESSGEFYYSWDFPPVWSEDDTATFEKLTETELVVYEEYSNDDNGDGVIGGDESYYARWFFEHAAAPTTRSGHVSAAPARAGTSGRGFLGR